MISEGADEVRRHMHATRALGRLEQFDARSRDFPIRTLLRDRPPRSYTWRIATAPVLDQGREGACVGFAWAADLAARPAEIGGVSNEMALSIYRRAQDLDAWEGNDYSGTSVIAGAKTLRELGFLDEFRWAFSLQDIVDTLGHFGPVVLGIPWYSGMYRTDAHGNVSVTGELVGGHAILARAVRCVFKPGAPSYRSGERRFEHLDLDASYITWRNSWSEYYGDRGDGYVRLRDLDRLIHAHGEACVPVLRVA